MTAESWINETGGRVRQQSKATQRALTFKSSSKVIWQCHLLIGGTKNEFARVQDKRLIGLDLDKAREIGLVLSRIDERILVVIEQPKVAVDAHVNARRLDHLGGIGLKANAPGIEFGTNVAVR
ncbi:MAG: hypothetical protein ACJAS7_001152 [Alpinimonas sp.]|jgi:hypothetical protein